MDLRRGRRWCMTHVVLPGLLLVNGNNTTNPRPTCHLPAAPPPTPWERFLESSWGWLIILTVVILASLGIVLYVQHRRWRRALREQRDMGLIDGEEFRRLGGRP